VFKKVGSIKRGKNGLIVSVNRSVVGSAIAALLVAVSVIAIISYSGIPAVRFGSTSTGVPLGASATTTSTTPPGVRTASPAGPGVLSVLISDPPRVPQGVTAVYIYYIGLAVHGDQGWSVVKSAGQIELLGTVNVAQTLSSANLPGGYYDSVKFTVTSAQVTYMGTNHTAVVQGGDLTIRIEGDTFVSTSQAAAALVDIQPTVINVGSATSPQFVLWTTARAFPVPQGEVNADLAAEGHRLSLTGLSWWSDDVAKVNSVIQLSGASLSASSLGVSVKDAGTSSAYLKLVVISMPMPQQGLRDVQIEPPTMQGSAVFVVLPNGTLVQFAPLLRVPLFVSGENQLSVYDALLKAGYNLTAGSSVNLSYAKNIELSFGLLTQPQGIVSGTTYWITVIGDDTSATTSVTAS
jgi:hypothetical protein